MRPPEPSAGNYFDEAYRATPPWDIGKPQPDLLALLDEFPPASPALDLGCGTGALALELARRGLDVLGIDLAAQAIATAQASAAQAPPDISRRVKFRVGDALQPSQAGGPFGTITDSGFFHIFGRAERAALAGELAQALRRGGRYYLLGFAIAAPVPNAPKQVQEDELRALFAPENGWMFRALRPAGFLTRLGQSAVPALAACIERT